jgi:carboxymethylenebutenolidase
MTEVNSDSTTIKVGDGTDMRLYVSRPQASGKQAGVIVLQEAFGVKKHIRDVCNRLAEEGYFSVAPELYHRTAPAGFEIDYNDFPSVAPHGQAVTPKTLELDLRATNDWLAGNKEVDMKRTAAIGFCMGGRAAFFANSILPLRASGSYYGGRIVPDYLPCVEKQHGTMLFFWGGKDAHILPEQHRAIMDKMREHKKPFINVEFSEADHGFLCDERKSYHAESARQAWALTTAFFKEHLS